MGEGQRRGCLLRNVAYVVVFVVAAAVVVLDTAIGKLLNCQSGNRPGSVTLSFRGLGSPYTRASVRRGGGGGATSPARARSLTTAWGFESLGPGPAEQAPPYGPLP